MLLDKTAMYLYVTVIASVCNNSNDSNEADVDAHGFIQNRKKGNFVVLFFDSDEVILDQYIVGIIVLVSHDFTCLYRTQYSRSVINCYGQGSHWLIESPHV